MKFLSEEWREAFEKSLKDTFTEGKTPTSITVSLVECYSDVPQLDGKSFWHCYELEEGVLEEVSHRYSEDSIPADADFVVTAPYETAVKSMTGELDNATALVGGSMKFKGNLIRAMKLMGTYNVIQNLKRMDGSLEY